MAPPPARLLMSAAPRLRLTPDEYLDWEARQEDKHEYHRGEVFAMAGGSATHARIIGNTYALLRSAARVRGCEAFTEAMRVRVDAADLYTYPDLSVVCGEPQFANDREAELLNPLVLVEVLSPSTEAYDRTTKWDFYAQIGSLTTYVLISQSAPRVDVCTRDVDGWRVVRTTGGSALIPALDTALDLAEVYDGVVFPESESLLRPESAHPELGADRSGIV